MNNAGIDLLLLVGTTPLPLLPAVAINMAWWSYNYLDWDDKGNGGPNRPVSFPPRIPSSKDPMMPFIPGTLDPTQPLINGSYPDPRWKDAFPAPSRPVDPLVLDLNRDGKIELQNATFFDLNANGFHEYTSWISETDAFLVLDKNGNGVIDNGKELFGDAMELPNGYVALTGFDALKAYDSNGDGKIDANDEIYASLKVLTGAGEMAGLADAGIKSINLQSEVTKEFRAAYPDQFSAIPNPDGSTSGTGGSGTSTTVRIVNPLVSLTFDERVQYAKDLARDQDAALRANGGMIRSTGSFEIVTATTTSRPITERFRCASALSSKPLWSYCS